MSDIDRTHVLRGPSQLVRDRCRWMAEGMFKYWLESEPTSRAIPLARKAIEAACIFEEEWQVAAMTDEPQDVCTCGDDLVDALMDAQNE